MVDKIIVKGARVHNLKNIDVEIPLNKIVSFAGVSGSGKSSLALGVLYSEGSRRYLEALSTYTRRRMTQAQRALVDEVLYVPAALALHQRPSIGGIRSTFGTGSELLNSLRLMFSRLASHCCPECGNYLEPSMAVARECELVCPKCGKRFFAPGAEELAFNSQGACETCSGTGIVRTVDKSTLVPDESLTIDEGAVVPWGVLMWSLMTDVCREMGVRTNIPFKDLTQKEKDIVFYGPAEKKHIFYKAKNTNQAGELDFTYYNAIYTVENALSKVKDEKGMKRVEKFLKQDICPNCHATRLSKKARLPKIQGISLDEACKMTLSNLIIWVKNVPLLLSDEMQEMAKSICDSFLDNAKRLIELGLGYLTLERSTSTLSTGERQRMQLARAVRNRTTGVLYVLDEPSIGLHPLNIEGLKNVIFDLIQDGNSVVLVDHDIDILSISDWMIEIGPKAGLEGGYIVAQGEICDIEKNKNSIIGGYLSKENKILTRKRASKEEMFDFGKIHLETNSIHTVKPLKIDIPKGRLSVVTGVSGSGKTTMVLESLIPALQSAITGEKQPKHIIKIETADIKFVKLIDASPIGINCRSTVATYANIHDELRKVYAKNPISQELGYKAGDFSYNTGKLRCKTCDGTGVINLDVQFLPDVEISCPECGGLRYSKEIDKIKEEKCANYSLSELMALDVNHASEACRGLNIIHQRLEVLKEIGLGYLTLGESTTSLSGGEAQRLKLACEIKKTQKDSIFVFDEPTIGLHPRDVEVLLEVFEKLIKNGATIVVIEHDKDVIKNADYIIDLGPFGGDEGGKIIYSGVLEDFKNCKISKTAEYL